MRWSIVSGEYACNAHLYYVLDEETRCAVIGSECATVAEALACIAELERE